MAAKVGARVLVDEVYLETLFEQSWRSAFHLGANFVVTSSLTKAYGLSGIRCGWILAQPDVVRRMWQVVDFTYGGPVHPAELLAVIALDNLDRVRDRARVLLETNRALVNEFLAKHPELDCEAEPVRHYGVSAADRRRHPRICGDAAREIRDQRCAGRIFRATATLSAGILRNYGDGARRTGAAGFRARNIPGTAAIGSGCWSLRDYCSFAYSALAVFRIGMSGSASFHSARKSW